MFNHVFCFIQKILRKQNLVRRTFMRKVYSSPNTYLVYFTRSILEAHNIESVILREQLAGVVGGIAPLDAWPELWIYDFERRDEALQLIESSMQKPEMLDIPWQCQCCGEEIEAQFTQCWKCDSELNHLISD